MSWIYDPKNKSDKAFAKDVALELFKLHKEDQSPITLSAIQTFSVEEVAQITNQHYDTVLKHIKSDPPLLIAKKTGRNFIITEQNLNKYLDKK